MANEMSEEAACSSDPSMVASTDIEGFLNDNAREKYLVIATERGMFSFATGSAANLSSEYNTREGHEFLRSLFTAINSGRFDGTTLSRIGQFLLLGRGPNENVPLADPDHSTVREYNMGYIVPLRMEERPSVFVNRLAIVVSVSPSGPRGDYPALAVIGSETPPQMSDGDRVLWVRIADCCPADAPVPKYSDPSMANPGQPTQPAVDRTSRRFDEMREVGDGHAGGRRESYTATKRNRIGNWAEAGDLRVRIGPEILLDSVTYASQSPDYYLIVKSVSIRNDGRYSLNLEEVRLGSCAPHLVVGGDLHPITPPQPEFMNRCGIMDLLRRQGISYGDIEPGQNVQLAPGHTITLAFVYSLSSPMLAEGEVSFRFWAVEVLEDGDARDYGGSTFILGARTR